jgi:glycosyltransferase involved in cell wall biosynthesis
MKIAFICDEYPPRPHGGIGTFVYTIAHGMSQRGHDVTVVGVGEKSDRQRDQRIDVITLKKSNIRFLGNLISRLRLRSWIVRQARRRQLDIVEAPDYMGTLPFGVTGCTSVVRLNLSDTAISVQAGRRPSRGIFRYERQTLAANQNWIAVSQYIMDLTHATFGLSPNRTAIIYNPVPPLPADLPEMPDLPRSFVLYAGQVSKRKGALVLAEAACEFLRMHQDLHLVYAGGELPNQGDQSLSALIRETAGPELSQRIHMLGHRDRKEVLACMVRARVFAFPSQLEALPLVVLEAMNCGVPVVCTNQTSGPEMVTDGVNGLLADPTSARDFSEKISRLLDDPSLASRLAENAKQLIAKRFSLDQCIAQTEQFFERCMTESRLNH